MFTDKTRTSMIRINESTSNQNNTMYLSIYLIYFLFSVMFERNVQIPGRNTDLLCLLKLDLFRGEIVDFLLQI